MFGTQNLAITALPCSYIYHTYCGYNYYTYCQYVYYSYCPYYFHTYHCGPTFLPQVQCPGITAIPGQVAPGDPVEELRALRQQLELALAGVRAQEAELQRQR